MLTGIRPVTHGQTAPAHLSEVWAGAVFAAVAALQKQLTDDDPEVVREVACELLDLEKTRLRHGRELAGIECAPLAGRAEHEDTLAERAEPDEPPSGDSPPIRYHAPQPHRVHLDHLSDPPYVRTHGTGPPARAAGRHHPAARPETG